MKKILVHQLKISFGAISEFAITAIFKCLPANTIKAIIEQYQQQTSCGLKPAENINIQQLQEMAASGLVTIGAHTINHPVLKNESDTGCRYEIAESVKQLELILEKPVKYLAYPNGRLHLDFGEREMNYLKESNIALYFQLSRIIFVQITIP